MAESLVIVPAKPWWKKGELLLALFVALLWVFQGTVDLAPAYGLKVRPGLGFAGAVAGLFATAVKFVWGLASPTTISGINRLDRSTRAAAVRERWTQ